MGCICNKSKETESRRIIEKEQFFHESHPHPLEEVFDLKEDEEWICDGSDFEEGCKAGIRKFADTAGMKNYRCDKCDFDLCEYCLFPDRIKEYKINGHKHPLMIYRRDDGWKCDGSDWDEGCHSGITKFNQTMGMKRFRCYRCNYNLCEKCILSKVFSYAHSTHPHALVFMERENDWICNGQEWDGGCRSGHSQFNQTSTKRYCCESCDFNLCMNCIAVPIQTFQHKGHPDPFYAINSPQPWQCEGIFWKGGCVSMQQFNLNPMRRFKCVKCNLQLCEQCCCYKDIQRFFHYTHPHPLILYAKNESWKCDGSKFAKGCLSGDLTQNLGINRYTCIKCNFNLCQKCFFVR